MQIDPSHEPHELTPAKKQKNLFAPFPVGKRDEPGRCASTAPGVFVSLAADRETQVNGMAKKMRSNDYQVSFSKIT